MEMTEQDYGNPDWEDYEDGKSGTRSSVNGWINSRAKWFCTSTHMLPENWFSDGEKCSSSKISNWYSKYSGGCDGIKVFYTGRSANKRTGEVYVLSFNVESREGRGFIEFGYHQ